MHPHGVKYEKDFEGAPYSDGSGTAGDAIAPGRKYQYKWEVSESAMPADSMTSRLWLYHSHTDSVKDEYSGLYGFMVITKSGEADEHGKPFEVDGEVFAIFSVMDENQSHYYDRNVQMYLDAGGDESAVGSADFTESNLMHSINGYVYNSGETPELKINEITRWYISALGTEVDLHTYHWHGNTLMDSNGK
eukprot:UN28018